MRHTLALLTFLVTHPAAATTPIGSRAGQEDILRQVRRAQYEVEQSGARLRTAREIAALYRDLTRLTQAYASRQLVTGTDHAQIQMASALAAQREAELAQALATAGAHVSALLERAASAGMVAPPRTESLDDFVPLAAAQQRALGLRTASPPACDRLVRRAGSPDNDEDSAVLSEVDSMHRELRRGRSRLELARMRREAAIESLRLTRNRFALDPSLIHEVIARQDAVEERESDYQRCRASLHNARVSLARLVGD